MRPNLMSPRRTSGEDSILAMLEREPARKRGKNATGPRLAWYGASAVLALGLTGALVWMAANNDGLQVQHRVLAEAGKVSALPPEPVTGPALPDQGAALRQVVLAAAEPEPQAARAAVIVDQAPPSDAVPPLRLLKPAPAKPAPAVRVPVPATAPAAALAKPVAKAPPVEAKAAPRPAAQQAKPKPVLVAKAVPRPATPKTQRGAGPTKGAEAGVDADVALISAVIVHANGHAPEGSQMTELLCPNDNCQARPPRP